MFSVQSLLVGNGTSVTCLRKSREPITALNVATYVTPLMVRNFWLWDEILNFFFRSAIEILTVDKTRLCKTSIKSDITDYCIIGIKFKFLYNIYFGCT